jgi:plasmid stabilization system protein ParE
VTAWDVVVTAPAQADIDEVLAWTAGRFGIAQAARYEALIVSALTALGDGPMAPRSRPVLGHHATRRLPLRRRASHYIVYRTEEDRIADSPASLSWPI